MQGWEKSLITFGINFIIVIVLFKIIDVIDRNFRKKINLAETNSQLLRFLPLLIKLIKALIIFFAATDFLQDQGYSVSSILAGFGIGGIAIGMAAKDALANIFGSLEILSDHAYKLGDYVKINDVEGYVEDINMRSTKIRSLDNFLINIPNNLAANSVITNVSYAKERFINLTIGVTYSTDNDNLQKAQDILKDIATEQKSISNKFTIAIKELADSSINVVFRGYAKTRSFNEFLKIRGAFLKQVIEKYREANIDFAFPSQSIYIESDNSKVEN